MVEREAVGNGEVSHAGAPQAREMGSAAQCLADVPRKGADIGTLTTHYPDLQRGLIGQPTLQGLNLVDDERFGTDFHILPFAGKLVGGLAINLARRESGRHLLDASRELLLQHAFNHRSVDVLPLKGGIDLGLEVIAGCRCS